MKKKVELLAPAGSLAGLYGAIRAGADAVYLGGKQYGARAYAENFTEEEMTEGIRYAHLLGRRVYLTANTLMKEGELALLPGYVRPLYEAGLDGVIVQDPGAIAVLNREFPGLKLHASTQLSVTGVHGARLLRGMGICRIVPARELSLEELKRLRDESGLELEVFVHGAMCYCYSGQCLFSSLLGGRSGNRGRCAQPCRLPYSVRTKAGEEDEPFYPLSLKDLCAIERIPALIEAGMDSFKIEGRMKKPEYAAGVTAIYRKYIDAYYRDPERFTNGTIPLQAEDAEALSGLYLRTGRQDGYYFRRNGREMLTLDSPAYRETKDPLLEEIRERYLGQKEKRAVRILAVFRIGEPARVTFSCEDGARGGREIAVTAEGVNVEAASRQPITGENIEKQLGKLGETAFAAKSVEVRLADQAFYPLKALNELRREAVRLLEEALLAEYEREAGASRAESGKEPVGSRSLAGTLADPAEPPAQAEGFAVTVTTLEQLRALWKQKSRIPLRRVGIPLALAESPEAPELLRRLARESAVECALTLPRIWRMEEDRESGERLREFFRERSPFRAAYVHNLEEIGFLREAGINVCLIADASLYHWNAESVLTQSGFCSVLTLPVELNAGEQRRLLRDTAGTSVRWEKLVYGRIAMMVSANCLQKTKGRCRGRGAEGMFVTLTDRYRKEFPVWVDCGHCQNVIYNSLPLSLHREWPKWQGLVTGRLDFTSESGDETEGILSFWGAVSSRDVAGARAPYAEYTTGHEKRGVE